MMATLKEEMWMLKLLLKQEKKKFEEMTLRAMESWIIMTEKKSPNDDWYLTRHTLHCNRSP